MDHNQNTDIEYGTGKLPCGIQRYQMLYYASALASDDLVFVREA